MNRLFPDVSSAMALSLAAHAVFLVVAAVVTPALDETPASFVPERESYRFLATLNEQAEAPPEEDDRAAEAEPGDTPDDRERSHSRCGEERGGSMGNPAAAAAPNRYGVQGPADNPDPHIARRVATSPPSPWEMLIGPPHPGDWGSINAPIELWGRDDALGNDAQSAAGNMWGVEIGAAFGSPGAGLGLSRLCPTCGASGGGPRLASAGGGGAIGTERASDLYQR